MITHILAKSHDKKDEQKKKWVCVHSTETENDLKMVKTQTREFKEKRDNRDEKDPAGSQHWFQPDGLHAE